MKKHMPTIIMVLVLAVGLSLLLYPTISDYWNSFHQSQAIAEYVEAVDNLDEETNAKLLEAAKKYNKALQSKGNRYELSEEDTAEYEALLDVTGTGIMGYVNIPSIDVSLPIYHGTEETVLQIGVGHLQGTSLPIGGAGTHSAISGHRGLTSSKLFTDIDQLGEGDIFMISVLGETLTYQIDQIRIVLPNELNDLNIDSSQDFCTLITCTPYGVNTHRLLVRGHRIANEETEEILVMEDAFQVKPIYVALVLGVLILILYVIIYSFVKNKILFRFR